MKYSYTDLTTGELVTNCNDEELKELNEEVQKAVEETIEWNYREKRKF